MSSGKMPSFQEWCQSAIADLKQHCLRCRVQTQLQILQLSHDTAKSSLKRCEALKVSKPQNCRPLNTCILFTNDP